MVIRNYFINYINMNINDFLNKYLIGLDKNKHDIELLHFTNGKITEIKKGEKIAQITSLIRIVFISDTHTLHEKIEIPKCHILIHCGDIALQGRVYSDSESLLFYTKFNEWLSTLPCVNKIVIGGNHDYYLEKIGHKEAQKILFNCTYLVNSSINIYGINFFGSPINMGNSKNKAYQSKIYFDKFAQEIEKQDRIDFLITHSNIVDLSIIKKHKIKYYVWGHYHGQYGIYEQEYKSHKWLSICACSLDNKYSYRYGPIIFDI
jgi:predicted MPP superfamily phosphohydrolase